MSKLASFAEYPSQSLNAAESALLTAWATLHRYQEDLVLVGGLAVSYLTRPVPELLPGSVTMDVDFGISLGAEGGHYGTIADDLTGQGFKREANGRFVAQFESMSVYIDFLTEHPTSNRGTVNVDSVPAGIFPGIDRALATREYVSITGFDLYGAEQKARIPISGIGPLLVLKLNAFDGRQQPKDAYDVLLAVSGYVKGSEAAITAFRAEGDAGNRGFPRASECLQRHFFETSQSGPLRCGEFLRGFFPADNDRRRQIVEQAVTVGRQLAGT